MRITKKKQKKQNFIQDKPQIRKNNKLWRKVLVLADHLESEIFGIILYILNKMLDIRWIFFYKTMLFLYA